ncbi:MAG: hypothetical protein KA717_27645 [Woronichinia naegeliana WA131]|jgi:hypothetical protein|uniref:Uncharacterized protein n=1 Tax=Woronichinia naegeliana WA131 TaxID=2824559 RepID=A0A977PU19_9CYAN|nr:MAG: hypothetical protein KA717_27645 [Woronichinia naegeliana WA131]
MGIDVHAVQIGRHITLEELAEVGIQLSDWLLLKHEFTLTNKDWEDGEHYVVNVEKTVSSVKCLGWSSHIKSK